MNVLRHLFFRPSSRCPPLVSKALEKGANLGMRRKTKSTLNATQLRGRQVLRVKGKDASAFLQGLVTNDVRHLIDSTQETSVSLNSMFAFILNPLGRVVADVLIHRENQAEDSFLLEVDASLAEQVAKMFTVHKLRKKVTIEAEAGVSLWSLYDDTGNSLAEMDSNRMTEMKSKDSLLLQDPRIASLGFRLLTSTATHGIEGISDIIKGHSQDTEIVEKPEVDYRSLMYKLGVGEGAEDHPSGQCFPLEVNGDYLHGISFTKGCYVGQELTARTYHTGTVRKRLMPIEFEEDEAEIDSHHLTPNSLFTSSDKKKRLGKLRSRVGKNAIALLYVDEVLKNEGKLFHEKGLKAKAKRPYWWPKESKKEGTPCGRADHLVPEKDGGLKQDSR